MSERRYTRSLVAGELFDERDIMGKITDESRALILRSTFLVAVDLLADISRDEMRLLR